MGLARVAIAGAVACAAAARAVPAAALDGPWAGRTASRAQAIGALQGGSPPSLPCLTPTLHAVRLDPAGATPAARRALTTLAMEFGGPGERRFTLPDGSSIRFTHDRGSLDRVDPGDENLDGVPDAVDAVRQGIGDARRILLDSAGIRWPGAIEVLLAKLPPGFEGYAVPGGGRDGRTLIVLDASPRTALAALRRSSLHQYAHAAAFASGPAVPAGLAEALATWAALEADRGFDPRLMSLLDRRLDSMEQGLLTDDPILAAGTALWFAFLTEAYGPPLVGLAVEELASGLPPASAFDRALRRGTGEGFAAAFREFQVWSLLVGGRDDGRHFSFASRLASPTFASRADGLPSLGLQLERPVGALGSSRVELKPGETRGGMAVRFDGDPSARWDVDLVLMRPGSKPHRVSLPLSADGRGEIVVPLDSLDEAILLVRNLDADPRFSHRFTWSSQRVPGFPFEIASLDAARQPDGSVLVTWETRTEQGLAGFNVLRRAEGATRETRINPVWIPAVGDPDSPVLYQFLDAAAAGGTPYSYRIEGLTPDALGSFSEPVVVPAR